MALLKDATRIYGRANVDNQLTVGSLATSNVTRSTSNTTGTIVLVGNAGIATKGNIYSGNIVITGAVNSNGITFADGTRQTRSGLEKGNTLTQTVTGPVIFSDSTSAVNSSSGALVVTGGIGAREGYFQYNVNVSDTILGGTYLQLATGNFSGANWTDAYTSPTRGGIQTNTTSHDFTGGGLNNGTLWFNQFTSPTISTVDSPTNGNVATVLIRSPIINASNTFLANVVPYSLWANGSIFTANNIVAANNIIVRGIIIDDQGNNTVTFGRSSPVLIQNTTSSTSNTTGSLVVSGGVGVAGNIYVGGTNAGVNGIYTDNIRYSSNGQPWVVGVPSTAWTSYTPTITAATGSFTTVSATGSYQVIGKTCFVTINISITTVGTAAGTIYATLPFTSAARIQIGGYGMEVNSTGTMLKGYIPTSSTQLQITTYSNGSTIGAGYSPILTVVYEIA